MATVSLQVGDRVHEVSCRDGEEPRLRALGAMLDERWQSARRAAGTPAGDRPMLFVALMLADALDEARNAPLPDGMLAPDALAAIAERLETLAATLERDAADA